MKKLSIFIQWLVVLGIAALVAYPFVKGRPVPDRHPENWRGWQGFMALSYPGIGKGDPAVYPTPERLAEQLEALHAAGYRTITPEDALAFLHGSAPLPAKALLLLFEGGRKDSIIYTAKPFQKTGFSGTLCLPGRVLDSRGAFYLRRGDLHRIASMGFWQMAAMGQAATDEIPVGPDGSKGHFLSQRQWTANGKENLDAFRQRVAGDYAACVNSIEKAAGVRPAAYVYPFADAGQGREADAHAAQINREQVTRYFQLAFIDAHQPYNGPGRDPFALSRLRVPGNITGADLVRLLERFAPRTDVVEDLHTPEAWQTEGKVQFGAAGLEVAEGAAAWPRGSANWSDVDVKTTVRISTNALAALYVRYDSPQSFLRATLSPAGIRIQENQDGKMRTLYEQPAPVPADTPVAVRLLVKGSRLWFWRDEDQVAGPLPLTSRRAQGRVGVGSETGGFQVEAFSAKPLDTVYALASGADRFPAEEQAATRALIAPFSPATGKTAPEQHRIILATATQGIEFVPLLAHAENADTTLVGLQTFLAHPIPRSLINRVAVAAPTAGLVKGLHDLHLAVIAIYPAANLAPGDLPLKELLPDDMVLVDGTEADSLPAVDKLLAVFPAYRTITLLDSAKSRELGVAQAVRYEP